MLTASSTWPIIAKCTVASTRMNPARVTKTAYRSHDFSPWSALSAFVVHPVISGPPTAIPQKRAQIIAQCQISLGDKGIQPPISLTLRCVSMCNGNSSKTVIIHLPRTTPWRINRKGRRKSTATEIQATIPTKGTSAKKEFLIGKTQTHHLTPAAAASTA